jgi:hypothetical protein
MRYREPEDAENPAPRNITFAALEIQVERVLKFLGNATSNPCRELPLQSDTREPGEGASACKGGWN